MILQQVEVLALAGQETAFETALCEVRQRVFMIPGFRGFAALQGVEDPATYLVQVRWESPEELLDLVDSGRFERCWMPVQPFLARPLQVKHFVERPGLAHQGPGVITDMAWMSGD
jgi:heme-degrading monooxygenase HmoA